MILYPYLYNFDYVYVQYINYSCKYTLDKVLKCRCNMKLCMASEMWKTRLDWKILNANILSIKTIIYQNILKPPFHHNKTAHRQPFIKKTSLEL